MPKWPAQLVVIIPDTTLSTHSNLQELTVRAGMLARFMAIAEVSRVLLYREKPSADDQAGKTLSLLLRFSVVPQYLRRQLFPIIPELRYSGLLPPLNIPTHPQTRRISVGDVRVALLKEGSTSQAWIDLDQLADVRGTPSLGAPPGLSRLFFGRLVSRSPPIVEPVDSFPGYAGFYVEETHHPLLPFLQKLRGLRLATSRYGIEYGKVCREIVKRAGEVQPTYLVFGSPSLDLNEMAEKAGFSLKSAVDYVLNLDPNQVVKSIRTDEAVPIALFELWGLSSALARDFRGILASWAGSRRCPEALPVDLRIVNELPRWILQKRKLMKSLDFFSFIGESGGLMSIMNIVRHPQP